MDLNESGLRQLKWIKRLLAALLLAVLGIVGSIAYSVYSMHEYTGSFSACGDTPLSFREQGNQLLAEGKLDEAVAHAQAQIAKAPKDPDGYWFLGKAQYLKGEWSEAIASFDKTEELAPSWRDQWTEPYRAAARQKLQSAKP